MTQCKIIISKFEKRLLKIQSTISIKLIYKICDISIALNENIKKKKNNKNNNNDNDDDNINDKEEEISKYIKSRILLQDPSKSAQTIYNTL